MKLQYRIGKLELDNMELEQSRIVHESAMRGKDLTIQKLQLQVTPASFQSSIGRWIAEGKGSKGLVEPQYSLQLSPEDRSRRNTCRTGGIFYRRPLPIV